VPGGLKLPSLRLATSAKARGGIWYFDFTNEGEDQSLKTISSARSVPVHAELITLGLLQVVAARAQCSLRLLRCGRGLNRRSARKPKLGRSGSGATLGACGRSPGEDVSLVSPHLQAGVPRGRAERGDPPRADGHSGGGVGRRYGRERRADGSLDRGISLQRLQTEINKISYGDVLARGAHRARTGTRVEC
jgi:hypothetical protein